MLEVNSLDSLSALKNLQELCPKNVKIQGYTSIDLNILNVNRKCEEVFTLVQRVFW